MAHVVIVFLMMDGCAKLETPKDIYQKSLMLRICRDGKFIVMRYTRERKRFITMVAYSLRKN